MITEIKKSTSEKVLLALGERGSTKTWLSKKMGISYVTLLSRLKENNWSISEIMHLQKLLNID